MGPIGAGAADPRELEITLGRRRMAALELGAQRRYALKVVLGRGNQFVAARTWDRVCFATAAAIPCALVFLALGASAVTV